MDIVTDIGEIRNSLLSSPEGGLSFIEQLQIVSNRPCTKTNTPHLTGIDQNEHKALLVKTTCKMWNCETCAYRNSRLWIARIINGVNKLGGDWAFVTITASGDMRGTQSVTNLRKGWKLLYNRILAVYGKSASSLYYAKVWEQHKNGTFHLHILCNWYLQKRWYKDNAFRAGMGYQADSHAIDNAGQVAGYIAKYTLKNAHIERGGVAIPKGLRRIETSHKWPVLPKIDASKMDWIFDSTREAQKHRADVLRLQGYTVMDRVKD